MTVAARPAAARGVSRGSVVVGFALGMFFDGILFHQILRWHHLVSEYRSDATRHGLDTNTFWDGVFHASAWVVLTLGLALLWRERRRGLPPTAGFVGSLLIGFGAFQVVDQLVFHLALGAHHIREVENYQVYDWTVFAIGVAIAAAGWIAARRSKERGPLSRPSS